MKITISSYFRDEQGDPIVITKVISRDTNILEIKELVSKTYDIPISSVGKISAPKDVEDENLFHSYISSVSDNKSLLKPSLIDADSALETQRVFDGANFFAELEGWPVMVSKYLRDQYNLKKFYVIPETKRGQNIHENIEKLLKIPLSEILLVFQETQIFQNENLPKRKSLLSLCSTEEPHKNPIQGLRDVRFWRIALFWVISQIDILCHLISALKLLDQNEDVVGSFIIICMIASILGRIVYKNFKKIHYVLLNIDILLDEISNCNEGKNWPAISSYLHGLFEVIPCCFMITYSLFKRNANENSIFQTSIIFSIIVGSRAHIYPITNFLEDTFNQKVRKTNFTSFLAKASKNYLFNQWILNLIELSTRSILFGLFCFVTFPYGSWSYLLGFYILAFSAIASFRKLNKRAYGTFASVFLSAGTLFTEGLFSRSFPFLFKNNLRRSYSQSLKYDDIKDDLVVVIILNSLKMITNSIFILFVSVMGRSRIFQDKFLFRYFLASVIFFSIIVMKYIHDIKVLFDFKKDLKRRQNGSSIKYLENVENNL